MEVHDLLERVDVVEIAATTALGTRDWATPHRLGGSGLILLTKVDYDLGLGTPAQTHLGRLLCHLKHAEWLLSP